MEIRELRTDDLKELKRIHEKHFANEFSFPDFFSRFLCSFVVEEKGKIISAGGVTTIVESIVITDKDASGRDKVSALNMILAASAFNAKHYGYDQLHAFIQDEGWQKQLIRNGFSPTKGNSLFLNLD